LYPATPAPPYLQPTQQRPNPPHPPVPLPPTACSGRQAGGYELRAQWLNLFLC
jgi:hypothetical protein